MNIKDQIRAEIERMREINKKAFMAEHISADVLHGRIQAINHLSAFLDTLPEQPVGWDDKNAADKKAVKEIVKTVHKEVTRQVKEMVKEQPASEELEKEVRKYLTDNFTPPSEEPLNTEDTAYTLWFDDVCHIARHFAEWGAAQVPLPEDTTIFMKGVAEGRRLEREEQQ